MNNHKKYLFILFIITILVSCGDIESKHEEYLQGEKIYAGKLDSLVVYSGYKRIKIEGLTHYLGNSNVCIVKWEGKTKEFSINNISNGKFEMIIDGLEERNYEFIVQTKDQAGNESILQTCKGKSIGDIFRESQMNRRIVRFNFASAYFSAFWSDKAESEYVLYTIFKYENNDGTMTEKIIMPDDASTVLNNWKAGGNATVQSAIISGDMGFDTLKLDAFESKLPNESVFLLDKALFKAVSLSKDTPGDGYSGGIIGMWDDVKGSASNSRYHTRDGEGVPHTLTFDLGVFADLDRVEVTGREGYSNWNIKHIQIWGCDNIENKDTQLPASDQGWEQEAIDKGWKLLFDEILPDPYENLITFDKAKTQKVRYIRIRAMEVVGPPSTGSGAYGCIQEITFWGENIFAVE